MVCLAEPGDFNAPQLRCNGAHHYAFVNPMKMMAAIKSLILLSEMDFHFAIYDSQEHVVLPDGQVAFVMSKATKVETYPVREFPFENYF